MYSFVPEGCSTHGSQVMRRCSCRCSQRSGARSANPSVLFPPIQHTRFLRRRARFQSLLRPLPRPPSLLWRRSRKRQPGGRPRESPQTEFPPSAPRKARTSRQFKCRWCRRKGSPKSSYNVPPLASSLHPDRVRSYDTARVVYRTVDPKELSGQKSLYFSGVSPSAIHRLAFQSYWQ